MRCATTPLNRAFLATVLVLAAITYTSPAYSIFCSTSHNVTTCDCSGRDDCRNMRDKKPCGDDAPVDCNEDNSECTCRSTGMRAVPGATVIRPSLQTTPNVPLQPGD